MVYDIDIFFLLNPFSPWCSQARSIEFQAMSQTQPRDRASSGPGFMIWGVIMANPILGHLQDIVFPCFPNSTLILEGT